MLTIDNIRINSTIYIIHLSLLKVFTSHLNKGKEFDFNTAENGGHRGMVPLGGYERVTPLDMYPTLMFRNMLAGDTVSLQ